MVITLTQEAHEVIIEIIVKSVRKKFYEMLTLILKNNVNSNKIVGFIYYPLYSKIYNFYEL